MPWRLYDVIKSRWYNDVLYDTREACVAAADDYRQKARSAGEVLELFAESLDTTEALELLTQASRFHRLPTRGR